jgi:hypothetical protein
MSSRPSARKVAQIWNFKTAKDLPKSVERYVQEGKDSGMDEGKAWAVAWSRYCKYKNPGSPRCHQDDYFQGRKASRTPECPREIVKKNLVGFVKSIKPVVADARSALKDLGYKITKEYSEDEAFAQAGEYLYFFELGVSGPKNTFTLKFSGDFEEEVVEGDSRQIDVDDYEATSEEVSCPPSKYAVVVALNFDNDKELLLRGRVTSDSVSGAIKSVGLSS